VTLPMGGRGGVWGLGVDAGRRLLGVIWSGVPLLAGGWCTI
jgi:hypothetical protein